jgi:hypothetical protein
MTTVTDAPAGLPPAQLRPSSIRAADVYGSFQTGVPTTVVAGTSGGARIAAATEQLDSEAPITVNGIGPEFLTRPAGILVILVVGLAALSFMEGGAG